MKATKGDNNAKPHVTVKKTQEPTYRQISGGNTKISSNTIKVNQKTIDDNKKKYSWETIFGDENISKLNLVAAPTTSPHLECQPKLTTTNNAKLQCITCPLMISGPSLSGLGRLAKRGESQGLSGCHYGCFFKAGATEQALQSDPELPKLQAQFFARLKVTVICILRKMFDSRTFQIAKRGYLISLALKRVAAEREDKTKKILEDDPDVIKYAFDDWVSQASVFFNGNGEVDGDQTLKTNPSEDMNTQFYASQKVWMPPKGKKVEDLKLKCKDVDTIGTDAEKFQVFLNAGFNHNPICVRDGATGKPIKEIEEQQIIRKYMLMKTQLEKRGVKDFKVMHAQREEELRALKDPFKQMVYPGAMATVKICLEVQSMKPPQRPTETAKFGVKISLSNDITLCQQGIPINLIPTPEKVYGETPLITDAMDEQGAILATDAMLEMYPELSEGNQQSNEREQPQNPKTDEQMLEGMLDGTAQSTLEEPQYNQKRKTPHQKKAKEESGDEDPNQTQEYEPEINLNVGQQDQEEEEEEEVEQKPTPKKKTKKVIVKKKV